MAIVGAKRDPKLAYNHLPLKPVVGRTIRHDVRKFDRKSACGLDFTRYAPAARDGASPEPW
jgi:hypothetical protein